MKNQLLLAVPYVFAGVITLSAQTEAITGMVAPPVGGGDPSP